ncbi:MAG: hypothetical protein QW478_01460 [Candidatus Micrarchaeaceae archaeon]
MQQFENPELPEIERENVQEINRLEAEYIKPNARDVYDTLKHLSMSIEEVWDGLFNHRSVPIKAAEIGFKILFKAPLLRDKVPIFVKWLSLNGTDVTLDDFNRLLVQLSRGDNVYSVFGRTMKPFTLVKEDLARFGNCGSLNYRGIACLIRVLFKIYNAPGFNDTVDQNLSKSMKNCQYMFRKSTNPNYLFVFEYRNENGVLDKIGINFNKEGDRLGYDTAMFPTFEDLERYLINSINCSTEPESYERH